MKHLEKVFRNLGRSRLLHLIHKLAWSFPVAEGKRDPMEVFSAWKKEFQEARGWEMEEEEAQNGECSGETGLFVQLCINSFSEHVSSVAEQALEPGCLGSNWGSVLRKFCDLSLPGFPYYPRGGREA